MTDVIAAPAEAELLGAGTIEWLPFGDLRWGPKNPYQRVIRPGKVQFLVDNWDPRKLGVFEIVRRGATLWVMGGQHRCEAALLKGVSKQALVQCHVQIFKSIKEEADVALHMDKDRTAWNAYDEFRAGLVARDPIAMGVKKLCDELGIVISPGGLPPTWEPVLYAIGSAVTLYRRPGGPDLLERSLHLLHDAWAVVDRPGSKLHKAYDATLLNGMAIFLAYHWPYVSDSRLTEKLSKTAPDVVLQEAHDMKKYYTWALTTYAALRMEIAYNTGARPPVQLRAVTAGEYAKAIATYSRDWAADGDSKGL